jgi:hypothetical protein
MSPPPDLDVLLVQFAYPGMPEPESAVFRDFLIARGREFDRFEFNVRLGTGAEPAEGLTDQYEQLAIRLTQKRADVVAWIGSQPTIIEVKIRIGLGAQGQLIGYRSLWMRDRPEGLAPTLLAIARRTDADTLDAFADSGIDVILYEDRP